MVMENTVSMFFDPRSSIVKSIFNSRLSCLPISVDESFQDYKLRIFRLTFHRKYKVCLNMLDKPYYDSFSDLFSGYLKTIDHLNLKLFSFNP